MGRVVVCAITLSVALVACSATPADPDQTDTSGGVDTSDGAASDTMPDAQVVREPGPARFEETAEQVGLDFVNGRPLSFCQFGPLANIGVGCIGAWAGGVAIGDFDGDGLEDVFLGSMQRRPGLFENQGDGTFVDVAEARGITVDGPTNSPAWADLDNDGDLDLVLTGLGLGRHFLFINQAGERFTEEAFERGAAILEPTVHRGGSVAFGDYDEDGFVDIYVAEWGGLGETRGYGRLLRNRGVDGPGFFDDVTAEAGLFTNAIRGFSPTFVDLDDDGDLDLTITGDFGTTRVYRNVDTHFENISRDFGIGEILYDMGSAFGDPDLDGDLDWFVSAISCLDETCPFTDALNPGLGNHLYENMGGGVFRDATDTFGVEQGYWGWGAAFFDYDNDHDEDLVQTNGWTDPMDSPRNNPFDYDGDPTRLWRNDATTPLTEASDEVGLGDSGQGRGLALFDYERDGDLDILVAQYREPSLLYRNRGGNANDWLRVRVTAQERAFEGLHAQITVRASEDSPAQVRHLGVNTGFQGQSERVAHFGLGEPSEQLVHELIVVWPRSGVEERYTEITRNQTFVLTAPAEELVSGTPATLSIEIEGPGRLVPAPGQHTGLVGHRLRVVAFPEADSTAAFSSWSGDCAGQALECDLTLAEDTRVEAHFDADAEVFLQIEAPDDGTTHPPPGTYPLLRGTRVAIYAIPRSARHPFGRWEGDTGDADSTAQALDLVVNEDATVTAVFVEEDDG